MLQIFTHFTHWTESSIEKAENVENWPNFPGRKKEKERERERGIDVWQRIALISSILRCPTIVTKVFFTISLCPTIQSQANLVSGIKF